MKLLRMVIVVGLAGMALMSYDAGMASATVLCKTNANTETCPEPYSSGQVIEASLKEETVAVLESPTGGTWTTDRCTGTTLKGKTANAGSSTESVKVVIEELTPIGCSVGTTTVVTGSLEFHWIPETDNATLTGSGTAWSLYLPPLGTCTYGFGESVDLGTLTGDSPATISINAILPKVGGSTPNCIPELRWTAEYTFIEPTPLYFTAG